MTGSRRRKNNDEKDRKNWSDEESTCKLATHQGNVNKRNWRSRAIEELDQARKNLPIPSELADLDLHEAFKSSRCREVPVSAITMRENCAGGIQGVKPRPS